MYGGVFSPNSERYAYLGSSLINCLTSAVFFVSVTLDFVFIGRGVGGTGVRMHMAFPMGWKSCNPRGFIWGVICDYDHACTHVCIQGIS